MEADGERVAEMVGGEPEFAPLGGMPLRGGHDPGMVDEDVQRSCPVLQEVTDRRQVGQVNLGAVHVNVLSLT